MIRPQKGKDAEVVLERGQHGGVELSIGLKPKPVRLQLLLPPSMCTSVHAGARCRTLIALMQAEALGGKRVQSRPCP